MAKTLRVFVVSYTDTRFGWWIAATGQTEAQADYNARRRWSKEVGGQVPKDAIRTVEERPQRRTG